ncbi:MAG: SRPBCC family protein [Candidatus Eremiobacteraeota bacterium]|nr:SRPBCC family protein [Candidatus Eremiobacteraeota bacterium]
MDDARFLEPRALTNHGGNFYSFTTRWRFIGTCEEVSALLEDTERIPQWWPSVYHNVRVVRAGGEHSLGKVLEVETKGPLPYTLRWRYEVVEVHYPNGSRLTANGDLDGEGEWHIAQDGAHVNVTYEWRVRANHPFIRRFGWFMRPLFAANHNWTMRDGERGMRRQLEKLHSTSS